MAAAGPLVQAACLIQGALTSPATVAAWRARAATWPLWPRPWC